MWKYYIISALAFFLLFYVGTLAGYHSYRLIFQPPNRENTKILESSFILEEQVKDYAPRQVKIYPGIGNIKVSFYTPVPAKTYLVITNQPLPFYKIDKGYYLLVSGENKTFHNIEFAPKFNELYFYIIEITPRGVIPFGPKMDLKQGPLAPYNVSL